MPIYEYKCSECGNVYEKRQKFSDAPDTECTCGKKASVFRVTSAPALVFKGSGWYVNDYAKAGKDGARSATHKDGASSSGSSSAASDSTPSAKSDSSSTSKTGSGSGSTASGDSGSKPAPAAKS